MNPISQLNTRIKEEFKKLQDLTYPTSCKSYQLYKICTTEGYKNSYDAFQKQIKLFYSLYRVKRSSNELKNIFNIRCYPWLENQFVLDFRSGAVSETELLNAAQKIGFYVEQHLNVPKELSEISLIHLVVYKLTKPSFEDPANNLCFTSFSNEWRKVSFQKFGSKFDYIFNNLNLFEIEDPQKAGDSLTKNLINFQKRTISITQTDVYWLNDVFNNLIKDETPPQYPNTRGPKIRELQSLEKKVRIFSLMEKNNAFNNLIDKEFYVYQIKLECFKLQRVIG